MLLLSLFILSVYKKKKFRNDKEYIKYMKVTGITALILLLVSTIIYPVIRNSVINLTIVLASGVLILSKFRKNISGNFIKGVYTATLIAALIVLTFIISN